MKKLLQQHWPLCMIILVVFTVMAKDVIGLMNEPGLSESSEQPADHWIAPSFYLNNTAGFNRQQLIYGEALITNTSHYFGPKGSVAKITNGMNCQNCHLEAGTRLWGNNYSTVSSDYPKFRDRSGTIVSVAQRVNDCFERSLNGAAIDTTSKEMKAIIAYISWLGADVKKQTKPAGSGITEPVFLNRAADPHNGAQLYIATCQRCHGANGEGITNQNNNGYIYPPLWGANSYNTGAGLYRLSKFAGFIKDNMPFDIATHRSPALTDEEAWDLASFVNSQPRPLLQNNNDWPDISRKPIDLPFGPYTDGFGEQQHKFGPYLPIIAARKNVNTKQ